jgi:hypothetical protein
MLMHIEDFTLSILAAAIGGNRVLRLWSSLFYGMGGSSRLSNKVPKLEMVSFVITFSAL